MDAVEARGFLCDYRLYPLNSYENRVYQVGIEDEAPLIAKFYRPNRWNIEQIQAEHNALRALRASGVAVSAPIEIEGKTLFQHNEFFYAISYKLMGESPEAGNLDHLYQIGELIGEIHHTSKDWSISERPYTPIISRIKKASQYILSTSFLPKALHNEYVKTIDDLILKATQTINDHKQSNVRFIHGDFHRSNIILNDGVMTALDFDDCRMGYAVQDLWMHLTDPDEKHAQLSELIEGYENFCSFDTRELSLIDPLIAERNILYTAWIAERWHDPAFPKLFPHFTAQQYWEQHLNDLQQIRNSWGNWH